MSVTKTFCDRCGNETTDIKSGHVDGIEDADPDGAGPVTENVDVCAACYDDFKAWAHQRSPFIDQPFQQLAAAAIRRGGDAFSAWMLTLSAEETYAIGRVFGAALQVARPDPVAAGATGEADSSSEV